MHIRISILPHLFSLIMHASSHLNEEKADRERADEMMESRLFSVSSHLGSSACLSDASLASADAAEFVLASTSELAASLKSVQQSHFRYKFAF